MKSSSRSWSVGRMELVVVVALMTSGSPVGPLAAGQGRPLLESSSKSWSSGQMESAAVVVLTSSSAAPADQLAAGQGQPLLTTSPVGPVVVVGQDSGALPGRSCKRAASGVP